MYLTNLMQIYMQTANMTVAVPVAYATVDWHVAAVCQSGYQPWQHDQCQPSAAVVTLAANSRVHQTHKVATLTFKAHRMSSPQFLSSLLNDCIPSRTLRPSSTPRLIVPRTRTELAKRAFCVAAPSLWNSLPVDVVDTNTVLTFKKHLKTYLYHCAYLT